MDREVLLLLAERGDIISIEKYRNVAIAADNKEILKFIDSRDFVNLLKNHICPTDFDVIMEIYDSKIFYICDMNTLDLLPDVVKNERHKLIGKILSSAEAHHSSLDKKLYDGDCQEKQTNRQVKILFGNYFHCLELYLNLPKELQDREVLNCFYNFCHSIFCSYICNHGGLAYRILSEEYNSLMELVKTDECYKRFSTLFERI